MTATWYIARNKQKFGPFTTHQLQQLGVLGLLKSTEFVLEEGATAWVAVASVPGVFPAPETTRKYWLSLGGKPQGPHAAEQIRVALMRRLVTPETLACPEGDRQWTPLGQLAEFRAAAPPPTRSSQARLGLGSSHVDLNEEEAELHLAGKRGDEIARLISTLLDLRRKYADNISLLSIIDRNVHDLKAMRQKGMSGIYRIPR
jgi:hypothetical protein